MKPVLLFDKLIQFQFTPLREGRPATPESSRCGSSYFNSRPSARGDHQQSDFWLRSKISIHAPPRGATRLRKLYIYTNLFQFTPLREGRPLCLSENTTMDNFNSRPSARGDVIGAYKHSEDFISIHAPPRGATWHWRWG